MKKKIVACLGLVLLAFLVTVAVMWWMPPDEPPLRLGMTDDELLNTMGEPTYTSKTNIWREDNRPLLRDIKDLYTYHFERGPDWLGSKYDVQVDTNFDGYVTGWQTKPLPRSRPPWLNTAMKWLGW